jgi:Bacterial SH3 domain
MLRTFARACLTLLLLMSAVAPLRGADATGRVKGVEALNVRRGPGTQHPAFATVQRGAELEVLGLDGSWVKVRLPSGETGYVHIGYLELPAGVSIPRIEATPEAAQTAAANPTATATPAGEATPVDSLAALQAENAELRARLAALQMGTPSAGEATPAASPGSGDVNADLQRLIRLTEEIRGELALRDAQKTPAAPPIDATEPPGQAATLALAGAGLVFGFVLGTAYGRRQERNRRTRVRF